MPLPARELPKSSVTLGQDTIEFRSLTIKEAGEFAKFQGDTVKGSTFIISTATGVSEEDASTWLDSVTFGEANTVVSAILYLSGLAGDEDDAGDPIDPKQDGSEPS